MNSPSSLHFNRSKFTPLMWMWSLCVLLNGCPPVENDNTTSQTVSTPSWQELVSAVRTRASDELRFADKPLSAEQASDLKIACQKLRILHIDQSLLSFEHFAEMITLLPELEQLVLDGPVDNQQLTFLTEKLPQLKILNVAAGTFNDEAVEVLQSLTRLELLRFQSPNVTDEGIKLIAELSNLKSLHLIQVPVTDHGLQPLKEMMNLESFYLDGSQCTEEGLSDLVTARPDLHFHWNQLHLEADPNTHRH